MESKKHFISNYITIFGVFFIWIYFLRGIVLDNGSESSSILVYLSFFMGFILLPKAEIIKNKIYKKEYKKAVILNIVYDLAVIIVYIICKQIYTPEYGSWEFTVYNPKEFLDYLGEFLDYLYLPMTSEIPLIKIVVIDMLLGEISIILSKVLINKRSYLLEKVIKKYFQYNYFITVIISIMSISKEYRYPREISYISEAIILIGLIVYMILYLISRKYLGKNANKDKLIVLLTKENFEFNFINQFPKGLYEFSSYKKDRKINILESKAEEFTVITEDLVRNNLVNLKEYTNVTYYIKLYASKVENLSEETVNNFKKKIEELQKKKQSFIIVGIENQRSELLEYLKDKYKQDYKSNMVTKDVVDLILEMKKDEKLNNKIKQLLEKYKDIEKNQEKDFVLKTLENMNTSDATRSFYDLMKICEYIIQYRALQYIVENPQEVSKKTLTSTSLGKWNRYQNQDKTVIKDVELEKALKDIKEKLELDNKIGLNYYYVCEIINSLRNKLMAHGSITYEISRKIVYDIAVITDVLINKFMQQKEFLEETDEIKNILKENKKAIIKKDNLVYLYNFAKELKDYSVYEYINYDTGKIIRENNNYVIKLNLKMGEVLNERKK